MGELERKAEKIWNGLAGKIDVFEIKGWRGAEGGREVARAVALRVSREQAFLLPSPEDGDMLDARASSIYQTHDLGSWARDLVSNPSSHVQFGWQDETPGYVVSTIQSIAAEEDSLTPQILDEQLFITAWLIALYLEQIIVERSARPGDTEYAVNAVSTAAAIKGSILLLTRKIGGQRYGREFESRCALAETAFDQVVDSLAANLEEVPGRTESDLSTA